MRVLGIDPGLRLTGYACLDARADVPCIVEAGVLRLNQGRAGGASAASVSERLHELDHDFRELLARLKPHAVAVESIFAHYKHPATAIVMGHARGVLLLAIRAADLPLVELKPNAVKKSLTGHGHAAKPQIQRAVQSLFNLEQPPEPPDVADAIAIALCASRRLSARGDLVASVVGAPSPKRRTRRALPAGVDVISVP
jgi:crossover junction endodeoxyribonuclease RuvC